MHLDFFTGYLSETVALASVALIGYLFGHRTRPQPIANCDERSQSELYLTSDIACDLQEVTDSVRRDLATHQAGIHKFTTLIHGLQKSKGQCLTHKLNDEAETLLVPLNQLTHSLTHAYDRIRKQSSQLKAIANNKIDSKTSLQNHQVLEDQITALLAPPSETRTSFSLALISLVASDGAREKTHSCDRLASFALIVKRQARNIDVVVRYGSDELAILMPQTSLVGASILCRKIAEDIRAELSYHVAGGIVDVQKGDNTQKILSRACSALYSAKSQGETCIYQHKGTSIQKLSTHAPIPTMRQKTALALSTP